jgi:hypothetical protein
MLELKLVQKTKFSDALEDLILEKLGSGGLLEE